MTKFKGICVALLLSAQCALVFAASHNNFLCGNDEDGCMPNKSGDMKINYTCNCITNSKPTDVCLDFSEGKCVSVDPGTGRCALGALPYPNRIDCLTTLWQGHYNKTNPSKNCVPLTTRPVAHICSVECTDLSDCKQTPRG
jgi:hypothetical protein